MKWNEMKYVQSLVEKSISERTIVSRTWECYENGY